MLLSKPFVLMLCVQFCFGLSYSTFFLLPKFLARAFHANADTIGAVASTALFAGVMAVPFIGAIIDRHTRRSVIVLGALVNARIRRLYFGCDDPKAGAVRTLYSPRTVSPTPWCSTASSLGPRI